MGPYGTIWDPTGPYGYIHDHTGLYMAKLGHIVPNGAIRSHTMPIRGHTGPYPGHKGSYGAIQVHTRPFWTKHGKEWANIGPYKAIGGNMGPYRTI